MHEGLLCENATPDGREGSREQAIREKHQWRQCEERIDQEQRHHEGEKGLRSMEASIGNRRDRHRIERTRKVEEGNQVWCHTRVIAQGEEGWEAQFSG